MKPSSISSRRGNKKGSRATGLRSGSKYVGTKPTTKISLCFCLSFLYMLAIWTSKAPEPWLFFASKGWNPSQWSIYAMFLGSPLASSILCAKLPLQNGQVTNLSPLFPSGKDAILATEITPFQQGHWARSFHCSSGFQNHWSSAKRVPSQISVLVSKPQPSWLSCKIQWSLSNQWESIFLQNKGSLAHRLTLGPKRR